jgi:methionyl-tRNA formyltransferase
LSLDGNGAHVQCGNGVIEILEMQKPGGKKTSASACLQTYRTQEKIMQFKKV